MEFEPTISIAGQPVLLAICELLAELQASGHVVTINEFHDVEIVPDDVHPECRFVLDANSSDVETILAADAVRH
jgi:hypothetical protein